ncbi:hypothetical protein MC378_10825 [Polaribacter sp. MSW13]|uniref:Uncharacterized protein n=1 Tax=Polaribacter marinus TaxID=2916838 RepID=A0A9X1VN93_9FLAO|nr:hypothetical protein [Polaribacter marinus]MCI2229659.1 hypothetical protein [Polaribacter marinus]
MFSNLKHSLIKKRFNKSLLNFIADKSISQKEILTVGILTTDEISSQFDLQKEIEATLNVRNVKLYSYRKYDKLDEVSFKHFSEKDINWKGNFTHQSLLGFLEQPFDLLIGYFDTNNLYLENAVLQSKSLFKTGFANVNPQLYDIEIVEDVEHLSQFSTELKKYLQILKKLKN